MPKKLFTKEQTHIKKVPYNGPDTSRCCKVPYLGTPLFTEGFLNVLTFHTSLININRSVCSAILFLFVIVSVFWFFSVRPNSRYRVNDYMRG